MEEKASDLRVILIGANSDEATALMSALRRGGYAARPKCAFNQRSFEQALRERRTDLVLWCDGGGAFDLEKTMASLARLGLALPVIALLEPCGPQLRACALRAGAKDMVHKGDNDHLLLVIERELAHLSDRRRRRELQRRYSDSVRTCVELLDAAREPIAYLRSGKHVYANPAYRRLFGYSYMTEFSGLRLSDLVCIDEREPLEGWLRSYEVSRCPEETTASVIGEGGVRTKIALSLIPSSFKGEDVHMVRARDLSTRLQRERQLARRDHLTGLISHPHFLERLEADVARLHEHGGQSALLLIELEHFRSIRETVGIAASDLVVRDLARVVDASTPKEGCLARFADHTFTLLMPAWDLEHALGVAEHIRSEVESHISEAAAQSVSATCSVGVVRLDRRTADYQLALSNADCACREAIHAGGNSVRTYDAGARESGLARDRLINRFELRECLEAGRLSLVFQPIVSLHGELSAVYQVEIQMTDEFGDGVAHDELLAAARGAGMSEELDRWLIEHSIRALGEAVDVEAGSSLFIPLSDDSVREPATALRLVEQLRQHGVSGERLIFELGEGVATGHVRSARAFVTALKGLGCGAALARFDAGANSYRTLKHLDVDYIEIDEVFVQTLLEDAASREAVRSIQETARLMKKWTVATRVGDASRLAVLWEYGVDYVKGDYVHGPVIELGPDGARGEITVADSRGAAAVH